MLLSQTDTQTITEEQEKNIVFSGLNTAITPCEIAVVLGTDPVNARKRVEMAVDFLKKGGCQKLIMSGGVKHQVEDGRYLYESELMAEYAISLGVKSEQIILESDSKDTIGNMVFSLATITKYASIHALRNVTIITEPFHLKRSLALAKLYFPKYVTVSGYTLGLQEQRDNYKNNERDTKCVKSEVRLLSTLLQHNWIDDIEF